MRTTSSNRRDGVSALVLFVALAILLNGLSVHGGYEGDDLNSVVPMMYLEEAKAGLFEIYRYAWQPLSYELGAALYRATGTLDAVFLIAPVSMAAALAALFYLARRRGVPAILYFAAIVLFPEILYSGLYYNSSAPAYALAVIAAVLLADRPGAGWTIPAAVLFVASILFRLDFIQIAPALFLICRIGSGGWRVPLVFTAEVCALLALAATTGVLDLPGVVEIYRESAAEIALRSGEAGWDPAFRLRVITVVFSPLGWLIVGGTLLWQVLRILAGDKALARGAILASLLPATQAFRYLLSVKYVLPLMVAVPVFAALFWPLVPDRLRRLALVVVPMGAVFFAVLGFGVQKTPPYVVLSATEVEQVGTHDGERSYGAYALQAWHFAHDRDLRPRDAFAQHVQQMLDGSQHDLIHAYGPQTYYSPGGPIWRDTLALIGRGPHEMTVLKPGVLEVRTPGGILRLAEDEQRLPADAGCILMVTDPQVHPHPECASP